MNQADVDAILKPLKPFQLRTVEHAFHQLFVASDSTARFLVADEVGLGKTLVARGIIAKTIAHLWETVPRIDIVYVCSNGSIARANLPKLQVSTTGQQSVALATRLTMLASELGKSRTGLGTSKVNFVSFTPGTSFEMGSSIGHVGEREVLFHLLEPHIGEWRTALMNLLQGNVGAKSGYRGRLNNGAPKLEPSIHRAFGNAFLANTALREKMIALFDDYFHRLRDSWPGDARQRRNQVIAQLRQMLAEVSVGALEPDLVILDEFQRFKNLLETREEERDPAAELAQSLFQARTPEGNLVRTLLLSATPYKLYTADAEIEQEDHYEDFLATTRFLMNDEARVQALKGTLSRFGTALKRAACGEPDVVGTAKAEVETSLRKVMARTERVAASADQDAMVEEPKIEVRLEVKDVHQYMAADALFTAIGDRDPMPFWKSAPYLLHFMRGYRMNGRLDETIEQSPEKVTKVLRDHAPAFLTAETVQQWETIDPANPRLRQVAEDLLDGGLWRLLWLPPTVPYWPLGGGFAGQEGRTKTLLFSSWNVVPDVVSAYLSYEAERRMMGARTSHYTEPAKQQVPLLRLSQGTTGRSRHRLLLLLLPCLPLADLAHPLAAPPGADRREWVRERVDDLLSVLPNPTVGEVDSRWEWAVPMLLDPGLAESLQEARRTPDPARPNADVFGAYVDDLLEVRAADLGRRPEGLAELVTEMALGSPAVLAARTLGAARIEDSHRRTLALVLAQGFWSLFNRPAVIRLLTQLEAEAPSEDGVYWRLVLRYCRDGNLQAVLDETWHLAWEQHAWSAETTAAVATKCVADLTRVVSPSPSRAHGHFLRADGEHVVTDEVRIRTDFAMRFGHLQTEDGQLTQDEVRAAFNSPFRPFVLASTSVGQEGLDFHPWCHRLLHWNLPGNPVDLEQREGRVHRYKGQAVRKNVGAAHEAEALARWTPGDDLWVSLFELAQVAARSRGDADLVPHWIAPGPYRVLRHVPLLPYTAEVEAFRLLKRQLAAYRVVFGQPRQEELVSLLDHANLKTEQLRAWAVDLSPPLTLPAGQ